MAVHQQALGDLRRLRGLVRKEMLQILRDPSSLGIAIVLPLVLLLLFGYGVSLDAENVPIAVVLESPSPKAMELGSGFRLSRYFEPVFLTSMRAAEQLLMEGEIDGIVRLRGDFDRRQQSALPAEVQVIVNGVDSNRARLVLGYVEGVWRSWLSKQRYREGLEPPRLAEARTRIWFNPGLRSRNYLVPGLVALVMTLIGAMLTALVIAREWERGTMEALLATPVRVRHILLGKFLPYFALGMVGLVISVLMGVFLFEVPLRGSFMVLLGTSTLFLATALGMGLFISTVAPGQLVASQAAILATFLPAFILSGLLFDIASMPPVVQVLTYLIAARYYVTILQTVFLAGDVWEVILPNSLALLVMATFFLGLTRWLTGKRLEPGHG